MFGRMLDVRMLWEAYYLHDNHKLLILYAWHHRMQDPADKWRLTTKAYGQVCKAIMASSPSIRFVGTINKYGRTITGFIRPGTSPMLDHNQTKNEFFILASMINVRRETEDKIGKLEHVLIRHEKVKIVLIPDEKVSYYVSIDGSETKYMDIIQGAKGIISDNGV